MESQAMAKALTDKENQAEVLDFNEIQLVLYQRLQQSHEVEKLLSLFREAIASEIKIQNISFTPVFQTQTTAELKTNECLHKFKLFAGADYLGQLNIELVSPPNSQQINLIQATAKLLAFPLRHAMEFEQALKYSELDALTELKNRAAMDHGLAKACDTSRRYELPLSLIVLDLDYFKKVNDNYGHVVGDKILKRIANIIQQSCRLADEAYRFGGEEFVMILPNTASTGAYETAERLRNAVEINDFGGLLDEKDLPITICAGVTEFQSTDSCELFLVRADQALYQAKNQGRNQTVVLGSK